MITFLMTLILGVGLTYLILSYLFLNGYKSYVNTPEYILYFICENDLLCRGEICLH